MYSDSYYQTGGNAMKPYLLGIIILIVAGAIFFVIANTAGAIKLKENYEPITQNYINKNYNNNQL
jgi:hypothetical protein